MTDNGIELTRRKILASVGAVGAAGAATGLGTSAFFYDEEDFANNQLVAGELDLKVDWEEHYSDWKGDEQDEAEMFDGDQPLNADYFLPATQFLGGVTGGEDPAGNIKISAMDARPIALNFTNSQDDFWDATSIEAYPDDDNDGIQDQDGDGDPDFPNAESICDTDSDLDEALSSDLRTDNAVTAPGDPLINLQDVKPGDFGEVTFSFHLCDNPGFVWMQGRLVEALENDFTDPELDDPDEDGPEGDTVELLDKVLTRVWRDDGDNQLNVTQGQLDVMIAIDVSGSVSDANAESDLQTGVDAFIDALATAQEGNEIRAGSLQFGEEQIRDFNSLTDPGSLSVTVDVPESGNTPLAGALDIADQALYDQGRSGAEKLIVVFSDGGPNHTEDASYNAGGFDAPRGDGPWSADGVGSNGYDEFGSEEDDSRDSDGKIQFVTEDELDETAEVASAIRSSSEGGGETSIATVFYGNDLAGLTDDAASAYPSGTPQYLENEIASSPGRALVAPGAGELSNLANTIVSTITAGEEVFFFGSLRQLLDRLEDGDGIPLDGDMPAEEGGGMGRDCFAASNTHYIGLEWWLPINHGNEIQGDSVKFDIGFYTEQCRHNDQSENGDPGE